MLNNPLNLSPIGSASIVNGIISHSGGHPAP
jgi:hypothetical protein